MTKRERTKEIILQLKQSKEDRDLSISEIYDMLMATNCDISMTTLKRVFAPGSEDKDGFRFKDTIQPIAQVMLAIKEETTPDNQLTDVEIDALKNIALLKDAMITDLQKENEALVAKAAQLEKDYAEAKEKIELLKKQAEFLTSRLHRLDELIERKDDYIDRLAKKVGI
jgi:predicted RNase H-like nuclease (RuvC/YqgF family)